MSVRLALDQYALLWGLEHPDHQSERNYLAGAHRKLWFPVLIRGCPLAELFHIVDGRVDVLRPVSFELNHKEEELQRWADANPHLLNEGAPMLSLGTEIETHHGHYIDNLFVDGNGCLVVAELKRGPTPRDVTAQLIDYAAYASRLEWPDVEELCRKRHDGTSLDDAYMRCFGRPLVRVEKIDLRLLIVAERYEPAVSDAALFLINNGTQLALLQFTYFEVGESKLFEVNEARLSMADTPEHASLIENPVSGAPGFRVENVFVFAGVPKIMQAMFDGMTHLLTGGAPLGERSVAVDLGEGTIAETLVRVQDRFDGVTIGSYPYYHSGSFGVKLVLRGTDGTQLDAAASDLVAALSALGGNPYIEEAQA